jgi:alpha-L-fucosidase
VRTEPIDALPTPLPRQKRWQDLELGVIYHFDMPLFQEGGRNHHDSIHRTWPPDTYRPEKLDTDQWLEAARLMGARYAIFTATHFNGFLQWQSDIYPYGVKQTSWRNGKADVVRDFVESCRRCDILPGLYLSCFRNAWWKVDRYRVNYGAGGEGQAEFARTCEKMVEELCSRYGELVQIWFDAGLIHPHEGGPDVLPIVDRHQPEMVFYHSPQRREHRWIGNEDGRASYPCWATMPDLATAEAAHKGRAENWQYLLEHGDPDGSLWSPGMVDTTLRDHHWFWQPDTVDSLRPVQDLVQFYYQSVGRNSNLVLGLTPDPSGLIPEPDMRRCEEFGKTLRSRFGTPLARTSGSGETLRLDLDAPARVDHVLIMERIRKGERIRSYRIEGLHPDNQWKTLVTGLSVGHKRIQPFGPVEVKAVRLRVTESIGQPLIRELALYGQEI